MEHLKSNIKALRRKNASDHQARFIPELAFFSVMTENAVRAALVHVLPRYQQEEILQKVLQYAKKIFAILLLNDDSVLLFKFIEADQLDTKLPFAKETLINDIQLPDEKAEDFDEKQWEFLAPTFSRGTLNRRFKRGTILPFIEDKEIGIGAFGKVYEVALDLNHQVLGGSFPDKVLLNCLLHLQTPMVPLTFIKFARKEFKIEHKRSTFNHKKELENLSILNHLKHPNIVELLGSYTYGEKHNLLFPLANTGNLAELLNTDRHSTAFTSDEGLVTALAELSSAVEHIHNFAERKIDLELIGCHHDLRPRNILVFGTQFKLADFGLSTFKPLSQNSETPSKGGMDDYLAPDDPIHRSSDIWSFGCILAEVTTYMVLGRNGIQEFREAREHKVRAFTLYQFHWGAQYLSEAVERWIEKLEMSPTLTPTLLVRQVRKALCMNQSERIKARNMTSNLRIISMHMIATNIDDHFCQIRKKADLLHIFLEHLRFNSWQHAIGILTPRDDTSQQQVSSYDITSQFHPILECLRSFREKLRLKLLGEATAQNLDVSSVSKLNDELHGFLSGEQKELAREYFNISVMEGDSALFERFEVGDTSVALDYEIYMRENIKHMNSLIERQSGSESLALLIEASAVEIEKSFGDHHLGRFNNGKKTRSVWVEWRKYAEHNTDEPTREVLFGRAARIAELLSQEKPEAFRTLKCSAFFHEQQKAAFGIIFDIPQLTVPEKSVKPTNLHHMLETSTNRTILCPDLDDRFKLASTLAGVLLELHTVGWSHKNLTASNIVFFPQTDDAQGELIREPFLVGFNHSRPDDPLALTSGLNDSASRHYQHPLYLKEGRGYRLEFDYYSLGIVLMEVGFWKPFSELTKGWTGSYEDRRRRLLESRVPRLSQQMGREYCEAVRCCIQSDFGLDTEKERSAKDLLLQFGERVVARLQKYFVD